MSLYALTIFLASFLLFLVQPLIGKHLLPWFGGAPAVWTTCLLFFQLLLLGGYAYAHFLARRLSPAGQKRTHRLLLASGVLALALSAALWGSPLLPGAGGKPQDASHPAARILLLLATSVGLPYFLLATTTPLLQAWFSREHPGSRVYRLYALSNLASLIAPIAYLAAIEPRLTLRAQAAGWSLGFLLFAGGAFLCAGRIAAAAGRPRVWAAEAETRRGGPAWLWFALSACGSLMLLAATNQMTQEVAAIPFLWVLPLGLYLLSFVLCFQSDRLYARAVFGPVLAAALGFAGLVLYRGFPVPVLTQVFAYAAALFASCMVCHGELARARPEPGRLTSFYLTIAAGGAAGGVFVVLLAPLLFPAYWEIHIALFLSALLALVALLRDRESWVYRGRPWPALLVLLGGGLLAHAARDERLFADAASGLRAAVTSSGGRLWLAVGAAGLLATLFATRRIWLAPGRPWFAAAALAGGLVFLGFVLVLEARQFLAHAVSVSRGFYGVLTVEALDRDDPERSRLSLRHGRIVHGFQYRALEKRRVPTTYYVERSGVALALRALARREGPLRVGIVGLGVGTLAAYGRPDDTLRFYEINPEVVGLSSGPGAVFTYARDSNARIEIMPGDARLALEREVARRPPEQFDLLAVDAFSSDSIPVHLLTREAVGIYLARLRPGGILALHVSNRHLDLLPVVRALCEAFGFAAAVVDTERSDEAELGSTWALLSREKTALAAPEIAEASKPLPARSVRLWTDDYSNLFQVLK